MLPVCLRNEFLIKTFIIIIIIINHDGESKGPETVPWATPRLVGSNGVMASSTHTFCGRSLKRSITQLTMSSFRNVKEYKVTVREITRLIEAPYRQVVSLVYLHGRKWQTTFGSTFSDKLPLNLYSVYNLHLCSVWFQHYCLEKRFPVRWITGAL